MPLSWFQIELNGARIEVHYMKLAHCNVGTIPCRVSCSEPDSVVVLRQKLEDIEAVWGELGVPAAAG